MHDTVAVIELALLNKLNGVNDTDKFYNFVVGRCFPKILARMQLGGSKLWTQHPLETITQWWDGHLDKPSTTFHASIKIYNDGFRDYLLKFGTPDPRSPFNLVITHEHLRSLLSLFCELRTNVLASLGSMSSAAHLRTDTVSNLKSYNALAMSGLVDALLERGGEELLLFIDDKRRNLAVPAGHGSTEQQDGPSACPRPRATRGDSRRRLCLAS